MSTPDSRLSHVHARVCLQLRPPSPCLSYSNIAHIAPYYECKIEKEKEKKTHNITTSRECNNVRQLASVPLATQTGERQCVRVSSEWSECEHHTKRIPKHNIFRCVGWFLFHRKLRESVRKPTKQQRLRALQ